jgi:type IV secretory pathway VirB2 component (pilin)
MDPTTVLKSIATFLAGPFGIALTAVLVARAGIPAMAHGHWGDALSAIGGGMLLLGGAWAVNQWF